MRIIRILLSAIIICFTSAIFAEGKKTYIFPFISLQSEISLCRNYVDILKQKLEKSDEFEIFMIQNFKFKLNKEGDPSAAIKNAVYNYCDIKEIKSAIFGYLDKQEFYHEITVVLYSAEDDNIITKFTDKLYNEDDINNSALNCAADFTARLKSIKSTKYLTASAFMPGLGQFIMKKYVKSAIILSSVGFCIYKYLNAGSMKSVERDTEIRIVESNNNTQKFIYLYKGKEVSFSYLRSIPEQYHKYNHDLDKKKKTWQFTACCVYLVNIIDILFSIKNYNDKQKIKQKLTLDINPSAYKSEICLSFHF